MAGRVGPGPAMTAACRCRTDRRRSTSPRFRRCRGDGRGSLTPRIWAAWRLRRRSWRRAPTWMRRTRWRMRRATTHMRELGRQLSHRASRVARRAITHLLSCTRASRPARTRASPPRSRHAKWSNERWLHERCCVGLFRVCFPVGSISA